MHVTWSDFSRTFDMIRMYIHDVTTCSSGDIIFINVMWYKCHVTKVVIRFLLTMLHKHRLSSFDKQGWNDFKRCERESNRGPNKWYKMRRFRHTASLIKHNMEQAITGSAICRASGSAEYQRRVRHMGTTIRWVHRIFGRTKSYQTLAIIDWQETISDRMYCEAREFWRIRCMDNSCIWVPDMNFDVISMRVKQHSYIDRRGDKL